MVLIEELFEEDVGEEINSLMIKNACIDLRVCLPNSYGSIEKSQYLLLNKGVS